MHGTKAYKDIARELISLQRWSLGLFEQYMAWVYGFEDAMMRGCEARHNA
jgi:hypothetical protein